MNSDRDNSKAGSIGKPIAQIAMNLKQQLKFFLELRALTASQLAKRSSVPKQSISGWMAGNNPRDVRQVKRVADILGVSLDQLFFGHGDDEASRRVIKLDSLLGDGWISGFFEIKLRRIKTPKE